LYNAPSSKPLTLFSILKPKGRSAPVLTPLQKKQPMSLEKVFSKKGKDSKEVLARDEFLLHPAWWTDKTKPEKAALKIGQWLDFLLKVV